MRTYVYIDGFNLYFGALKGTPHKWLNPTEMVQKLIPSTQTILKTKYFTSLVKSLPHDPMQRLRQKMYIRALETLPNFEVFYGHFLSHPKFRPLANPISGQSRFAEVIETKEKGSDVNLATHLLADGFKDEYDVAIIVSNDSDLLEPVKVVQGDLSKDVGILNPHDNPAKVLLNEAKFYRKIRQGVLSSSQLPEQLSDSKSVIDKPSSW